jgi:enterochelin esterase-like enzyme
MRVAALMLLGWTALAEAGGNLSLHIRISSDVLGYDLQYRVYEPETATADSPVLFVTDGPGYIHKGRMPRVLDRLIERGEIEPLVVIFVDAQDPDSRGTNRRNSQFLCNPDYLEFYRQELIPAVEAAYPVSRSREDRGILGLSFGATNAACFGLLGSESFSKIGMHSPANHPVTWLLPAYEKMPMLPLTIFMSTGRPDDNTHANRKFRDILRDKGYPMHYVEVREGHNWDNWRPLIDDALIYLFGMPDES